MIHSHVTYNPGSFVSDFGAGAVGALLALPQAIALALLAGMPVEYGFYTSIVPVTIAALSGSSWHAVAGPNTAICVVIASTMVVFGPLFSETFVAHVLLLTLFVGAIQLFVGLARLGSALDFISQTVIGAVVLAVAVYLIVVSLAGALGLPAHPEASLHHRLSFVWREFEGVSPASFAVAGTTVVAGLIMRRIKRVFSIVIALFSGVAIAALLRHFELLDAKSLSTLGTVPLTWASFQMPDLGLLDKENIVHFSLTAAVIAFLGLMQSVVIARSLSRKSGQLVDTNREIIGQGLANFSAPFVSAFAGSGSFNRSAANYDSGARSPLAAVFASVFLLILAVLAADWLAIIPNSAVSGILILVGIGLINPKEISRSFKTPGETAVFLLTLVSSIGVSLTAGVLVGVGLSLVIYLAAAARPSLTLRESTALNGKSVTFLTIGGSLFFGSVRTVEKVIADITERHPDPHYLVIETDYLAYIDASGLDLLEVEILRHKKRQDALYVLAGRQEVSTALKHSEIIMGDSETIIYRDRDHPMKTVLYPSGSLSRLNYWRATKNGKDEKEKSVLDKLAERLVTSRQLGCLSRDQIDFLLKESKEFSGDSGDILHSEDESFSNYLLLLNGNLEAQHVWKTAEGARKSYTWNLESGASEAEVPIIAPSAKNLRLRAITPVRYLLVDADLIDSLSGWTSHFAEIWAEDEELRQLMAPVRDVSLFMQMSAESVALAFKRMRKQTMQAGEIIVKEGEPGDSFYIVRSGAAEVWRSDPFSGETEQVATLVPGNSFGEEALLQEGFRNATVKMTSPGELLVLEKADFDDLVRPCLVEEVTADQTKEALESGTITLLDCRYEMEFEESRIPGAKLVPLDQIRQLSQELSPDIKYIVYCRSGRRSKAAAYLMMERNLAAKSMIGGIKNWPYEVEIGIT